MQKCNNLHKFMKEISLKMKIIHFNLDLKTAVAIIKTSLKMEDLTIRKSRDQ